MTDIRIIDFSDALQADFERLNREWLEKYFVVEDIDRQVLGDPRREIIDHGGTVLFARDAHAVIGTCALKHHGDGVFELTKMAVTEAAQGRGAGRLLIDEAVARFRELGGRRLFLESHRSLEAAIRLYRRTGFRETSRPPGPSLYTRCNIYMVWRD
jgi:ribosomal protein S18 acetylase RimI-like enzyme